MRDRFKRWKPGRIGPSIALLGALVFTCGLLPWFVTSFIHSASAPGITGAEDVRRYVTPYAQAAEFWSRVMAAGTTLIAIGLFVMLFQGILCLVRRAGVAKSKE